MRHSCARNYLLYFITLHHEHKKKKNTSSSTRSLFMCELNFSVVKFGTFCRPTFAGHSHIGVRKLCCLLPAMLFNPNNRGPFWTLNRPTTPRPLTHTLFFQSIYARYQENKEFLLQPCGRQNTFHPKRDICTYKHIQAAFAYSKNSFKKLLL